MGTLSNPFDFTNKEAEEKEKNTVAKTIEYMVEAYQIARLVKQGSGRVVREIKDTIKVENGDVDRAKRRAVGKADMLGNGCFVIEKCERIVSMRKLTPQPEAIDEEDTDYND